MAAVTIENLHKTYPATSGRKGTAAVKALNGVDLNIEEGGFYGLLGPNGAGKTTLINTLIGLADPDQGTVSVFDQDVTQHRVATQRRIGVAPQETNFDVWLGLRQILEYNAAYYGIPKQERRQRMEKLLHQFDLADKGNADVRFLSGGMKRRLLLARALMHDPDLLILDEPTAGIDASLRRELWEYIRGLNKEGKTILLTTHYIEEAEALCEEVAIMNQGEKIAEGKPEELIREQGVEQVSLTMRDIPDSVIQKLEESSIPTSKEGRKLVLENTGWDELAPVLVKLLSEEQDRIQDMQVIRSSLEDIFIEMTTGDTAGETQ